MESCGFVPELVCWNSFEEQIQFEDANVQLLFGCEQIREQSSGLMSIFWPSDPAASCDQIMAGDHAMEGEQLAASFIQIDAPDRFEAYSDECSLWNAAPDESNADEAGAAGRSKKKARLSSAVQRAAKSTRSKKKKKGGEAGEDEESSNGGLTVQSSSSCSSEDDEFINVSPNGSSAATALNITGKARAERGAATDPQSLYARKRRERINERLRILQTLVPNGTKVDISTMLEEAVQYVKFLQLQIKLLSSDELWKYAPLAYNGMNIGFDLMIPATRL